MKRDLFTPDRLYCPGPTPVPRAVAEAAADCALYHRSEEFYQIFRECSAGLKPIFGTKTLPLILTSSGSGAMEAAMTNLTAAGDEVVVVNGGKFGERWEKLARVYQCQTEVVSVPWGEAPSAAQILAAIAKQKKTRAVFIQANETSTGAYYPVEQLAREIRARYDGLLIVDAISSLGAHAMRMDDWRVDAVVAGSQKGFGMPPGLAFVALGERAWGQLSARPRFYFDLAKELKGQTEGRSAYTPASSLVVALGTALRQIHAVGLDAFVDHHRVMAEASRAAMAALGIELFARTCPSQAVTSVVVPGAVNGGKLLKRLRQRFGMFFAGGQDELKGKIVRFSHLGFVSRFDVLDGLAAFEFALAEEGLRFEIGAGVRAAMQRFASTSA